MTDTRGFTPEEALVLLAAIKLVACIKLADEEGPDATTISTGPHGVGCIVGLGLKEAIEDLSFAVTLCKRDETLLTSLIHRLSEYTMPLLTATERDHVRTKLAEIRAIHAELGDELPEGLV
jgi:hypothetical protein